MKTFFNAALTLLLPVDCGGCSTRDTRWCNACATALGRERLREEDTRRPVEVPFPVFAATAYAGLSRESILRFKELGRTDLKTPLAELLTHAVDAARAHQPDARLWCVAIPSHPKQAGRRGYQHVQLLLAALPSRPHNNRWLRVSAHRTDQVGLGVFERQRNSRHAFVVPRRLRQSGMLVGKQVLLVDDIATTGSTLAAAAAALQAAGAQVLAAAVVAHTVKLNDENTLAIPKLEE